MEPSSKKKGEPKPTEFRFALTEPIEAHGDVLAELVFPLPFRVKHLQAIDNISGNNGRMAKLIEVVAKIPASSVSEITWQDFEKIATGLQPFLSGSQTTGET